MKFILNVHRHLLSIDYGNINWRSPKTIAVIIIILASLFALSRFAFSGTEEEVPLPDHVRQVAIASVEALASDTTPLPLIGEVTSRTEADIRSESGGRITGVYVELGDSVVAGRIIAETENSAQRAALLQAEGAYDAAKAALEKVRGGTRNEQLAILQSSLDSAQGSAVATLLTAYGSVNSAIEDTADQMFTGIELASPSFKIFTSNQQREADLEHQRAQLESVLARQSEVSKSVSKNSDLKSELSRAGKEVRATRIFLDTILAALAEAIPSDAANAEDIVAYKAAATAARTSLTSSLSAIATAESALEVAEKSLEQGITGAQGEDIAAAEASVKQGEGSYNAALSALEKTRIRSPISGSVNNLSISTGDFVSPQQQVAVVSNNRALEVVTYVTEHDRENISIGASVLIEGTIAGSVTRVAPALDPTTRKIEVRVGLPQDTALTNGQSVRLEIARAPQVRATTGPISIPISAIKIEATRTVVFTLEDDHLVAHEVSLGPLLGDKVQVLEGLGSDWYIVTDARGLKEGQEVVVESN